MNLCHTYGGIVEANRDPLKLGRLKIRVPHVYGSDATREGYVGINDLPWANPTGMPAGTSPEAGGYSQLPEIGDSVNVRFLDGEPEKPIWEWGMQTLSGAAALKLHEYATAPGEPTGAPDRAILSRYGHSLEIKKDRVILTTGQGYQLVLNESTGETGGSVALNTPAGQALTLNDLGKSATLQAIDTAAVTANTVILNAAADAVVNAGKSFTLMAGGTTVVLQDDGSVLFSTGGGASVIVDTNGNISAISNGGASVSVEEALVQVASPDGTAVIIEDGKISVSGKQVVFNSEALAVGTDAKYPAVMLTPALIAFILTHTHTGNLGFPTSTPTPGGDPLFPQNAGSTRLNLT